MRLHGTNGAADGRRVCPASSSRLPELLLIGAAQAGAELLVPALRRHPGIFVSRPGEPQFFSHDHRYLQQGLDWYGQLFAHARAGQLCMEASTAYTRWPEYPDAAARIAQVLPQARFIYLMRDPIERAYDHYVHRVTHEIYPDEPVPVTFEQHLRDDPVCLHASLYMDQIERYLRWYPRSAFLFLFHEDLIARPRATLAAVWRFLGLPPVEQAVPEPGVSAGMDPGLPQEGLVRRRLIEPIQAMPGFRLLRSRLSSARKARVYDWLRRSMWGRELARRFTPPPMRAATREELRAYFREPNERLGSFLRVDLSHWDQTR